MPGPLPSPELAIILPTLNEAANIGPLIARIGAALPSIPWEVIVVDDRSGDRTAEIVRQLAQTDGRIRIIERMRRRGLSSAVIDGFCATAAPYVAVLDADHQHDPALLPRMLETVRRGDADVVVASRYLVGGSATGLDSRARAAGSDLANRIARWLTGVELSDPMSGYFLLPSALAQRLAPELSGIGFKILLDLLATSNRPLAITEIPLEFARRREGQSKLDRAVVFDFLVGLYHRMFGRILPTRFMLFGTVGALGVLIHFTVLTFAYPGMTATFWKGQAAATIVAMTFNFLLNNWLTYRDQRLHGTVALIRGWTGFVAACSLGALANVAVAGFAEAQGVHWALAAMAGILVGAVWNYALSSRFVWGRYT